MLAVFLDTVYFQKLESLAYICVSACMGLSSFKFVQWPVCFKRRIFSTPDSNRLEQSAFWPFKVIQGRLFWYQSKAVCDFILVGHFD